MLIEPCLLALALEYYLHREGHKLVVDLEGAGLVVS